MNDKVSQDDIDNILKGMTEVNEDGDAIKAEEPAEAAPSAITAGAVGAPDADVNTPGNYEFLTTEEADTLGEISNIFMGSASTTLSMLLGNKVDITTPRVYEYKTIGDSFVVHEDHIVVSIKYIEGLDGTTVFALKVNDSAIIANLMMGGDGKVESPQISELELSAVSEAMNQMVGSASTSLSSMFNCPINISAPIVNHQEKDKKLDLSSDILDVPIVAVKFQLIVGDLINSEIIQIMNVASAKTQVSRVMNMMSNMSESVSGSAESVAENAIKAATIAPAPAINNIPPAPAPAPMHQTPPMQQQQPPQALPPFSPFPEQPQKQVTVQPVQFASFDSSTNMMGEVNQNLNLVMDVKLELTVELGKSELPIKNVLELTKGSIIELDKVAGEPVELYANGKLIAKGEVVVIEDNFGLRITTIVSPEHRLKAI